MTYQLVLGDPAYSSWSMRAWLLFDRFALPVEPRWISFAQLSVAEQVPDLWPTRTVPAMVAPDGAVISDTLAIAEELATRHPDSGLWPHAAQARAIARSLTAEMHAGFDTLRQVCPMNLRCAYSNFVPSQALEADLRRLETVWAHARKSCHPEGPWLCGDYSIVDAFFAPVAARIAGYDLKVDAAAQDYVNAHLSDPSFLRWRDIALSRGPDLPRYARDYTQVPWPAPHTG
ncbi:MAG: glutathione S-transferase [Paracoccaceae bacterium]|jgi:glutathione S-transferase